MNAYTKWNSCLAVLQGWIDEASTWNEKGLTPPSIQTIRYAMKLAVRWRDAGLPGPTRAVPNGEGGIAFECRKDSSLQTFTLTNEHIVIFDEYQNNRLLVSKQLPLVELREISL